MSRGVVALAGLAVAWVATNGQDGWLYEGGFALCSAAGALAVAAVWARPSGILARPLTWSPLRFLGLISYGLYLWHWPVIVIATPLRTGLDGLRLDAFRVALSLGLATASYHLLEMPIRRGTLLRGRPAWAGALGVPVLCVVAVVAATVARPTPFTREVELAARHPERLVEAEDDPAVVVPTTPASASSGARRGGPTRHDPGGRRLRGVLPREGDDDRRQRAGRRRVQPRHHRLQHRPGAGHGPRRRTDASSPGRQSATASWIVGGSSSGSLGPISSS